MYSSIEDFSKAQQLKAKMHTEISKVFKELAKETTEIGLRFAKDTKALDIGKETFEKERRQLWEEGGYAEKLESIKKKSTAKIGQIEDKYKPQIDECGGVKIKRLRKK